MAYHVSLVNTDKKDISYKLIMNKEKFREFLFKEFNMKEEINKNGTLEFYYDKDDPSFTIFITTLFSLSILVRFKHAQETRVI